ncbi:MAG: GPW/gp25 family protein [Methanothrix sp.]
MSGEFLGRGWKFPVNLDPAGGIASSEYEEDVREDVALILRTSRGERVMQPDFGCGIHEMAFSVINSATAGQVEELVKEALILWEPRIEVTRVKASIDTLDDGRMLISIDYRVRTTNSEFNLVYPFYLKE